MAYTKHTWVAPQGSNLNRFTKSNETPTSVNLVQNPNFTNTPTPFSPQWMNEMEQGIADAHQDIAGAQQDIAGAQQSISQHGSSASAHADIRQSIAEEAAARAQGDSDTLASARSYADGLVLSGPGGQGESGTKIIPFTASRVWATVQADNLMIGDIYINTASANRTVYRSATLYTSFSPGDIYEVTALTGSPLTSITLTSRGNIKGPAGPVGPLVSWQSLSYSWYDLAVIGNGTQLNAYCTSVKYIPGLLLHAAFEVHFAYDDTQRRIGTINGYTSIGAPALISFPVNCTNANQSQHYTGFGWLGNSDGRIYIVCNAPHNTVIIARAALTIPLS